MKRRLLDIEKFTYTVNYNAEGATVLANGENVGTISGGTCVFYKYGNSAEDSYSITFTGGTMTHPEDAYTFSVSPTSLSFAAGEGTQSVNVTSTRTTYSNSHNSGTVSKNSTLTLTYNTNSSVSNPTYSASASGTGLSVSGVNITFAANTEYAERTGTITFTQSGSNKTATVNCTQAALTLYNYTVNSNCNGGTVYFNNVNKGTISNSKLTFTDEASSGTVRISGGVPSNNTVNGSTTTEYGYSSRSYTDYDYDTDYDCSVTSSVSHAATSGTSTATIYNRSRSMERSRTVTQPTRRSRTATPYTTYTYTAPANQTCQGNSSVTMNYTSSTSTGTNYGNWSSYSDYGSPDYGSWGSWSYGSWSSSTPSLSSIGSWYSASATSSRLTITFDENTGSSRSDTLYVTLLDGRHSVTVSQSAGTVEFYITQGGSNVGTSINENEIYASNDTTHTGFNIVSRINGRNVGGTLSKSGTSTSYLTTHPSGIHDYYGNGGMAVIYYWNRNNTGSSVRGPVTVTATQATSGRTLTIREIRQCYVNFELDYNSSNTDSISDSSSGGTHTWYINCQEATGGTSYSSTPSNPTWSVTSKPSWITISKAPGTNGSQLVTITQANTSTSSRSGTLVLTESHVGKTIRITFTQAGSNLAGLSISPSYKTVSPPSGSFTVSVTSSDSSGNWVNITRMTHSGDGNASYSTPTGSGRTRTMTISYSNMRTGDVCSLIFYNANGSTATFDITAS